MWVAATHIFSAKIIRILYIESAKTVNEMTLNELVKLTTLWATGPWRFYPQDEHLGGEIIIIQVDKTNKGDGQSIT